MKKMEADKNSRKLFEAAENLEPVLYPIVPVIMSQFILFKVYPIPRYTIVHQFLFLLLPIDFYVTVAVC